MITINKIYDYKKLDKTEDKHGNRLYQSPTGSLLPSVTTILDATSDKSGLIAWRARVGDKKADQISAESCALGSLMHEHLENHIQNIPRPSGSNIVRKLAHNMADQIINRGLIHVSEVWGLESQLYYDGLYAGTSDLIAKYNDEPAILDYKTAKKIKSKKDIENYFLQLCAYSMAHNHLFGTNIKQGVIFMVTRDLEFETFVIAGHEYEKYNDMWLSRLEMFYG